MGVHLGVWRFIPSHSFHSWEYVMWFTGLPLGSQPYNPLPWSRAQGWVLTKEVVVTFARKEEEVIVATATKGSSREDDKRIVLRQFAKQTCPCSARSLARLLLKVSWIVIIIGDVDTMQIISLFQLKILSYIIYFVMSNFYFKEQEVWYPIWIFLDFENK